MLCHYWLFIFYRPCRLRWLLQWFDRWQYEDSDDYQTLFCFLLPTVCFPKTSCFFSKPKWAVLPRLSKTHVLTQYFLLSCKPTTGHASPARPSETLRPFLPWLGLGQLQSRQQLANSRRIPNTCIDRRIDRHYPPRNSIVQIVPTGL